MKKIVYACLFIFLGFALYMSVEIFTLGKSSNKKESSVVSLDSNCNLQKNNCDIQFLDDSGLITIAPKPFFLNEKIKVLISFTLAKERNLQIDLKGLDMDMGYNRFKLKTVDNKSYTAQFFLPTCTKDYMPWQMAILKQDLSETKVNLFKFLAEKK